MQPVPAFGAVFGTVFNSPPSAWWVTKLLSKKPFPTIDVRSRRFRIRFAMESDHPIGFPAALTPPNGPAPAIAWKSGGTVHAGWNPNYVYLQGCDGRGWRLPRRTPAPSPRGGRCDAIGYPTLVGKIFRPGDGTDGDVSFGGPLWFRLFPKGGSRWESLLQGHEDSMLVTVEGKLLAGAG